MEHVADRWHVVKAGTKTRTDRYGCGSRWQAVWLNPATNRELTKAFANKVDAQRWLDEVNASVVTGMYVDPKAGKETVTAYGEQWRAVQVHRPSTAELYEIVLRRHRR